jgi:hypothetical protein
LREERTW